MKRLYIVNGKQNGCSVYACHWLAASSSEAITLAAISRAAILKEAKEKKWDWVNQTPNFKLKFSGRLSKSKNAGSAMNARSA